MIVLECMLCGRKLLDVQKEKKYLEGKKVTNDGCVVSAKIINGKEYRRNKCYECFEKKYNRKPKRMNLVGYDMCFLMDVPETEIKKHRALANNVTKENMIKRYGKVDGLKRWDAYRKKQANVNSFEHKKEKFGWTLRQFDEFNKSRAVTLDLCIKRHGVEKGKKIYEHYCKQQSYVGCKKEYFVEKYGIEKGTKEYENLNKKKKLSLENFIRKYGKTIGEGKFKEWLAKDVRAVSFASIEFCEALSANLKDFLVYHATQKQEYGVWLHSLDSYAKLDFYVLELNKGIEFYGDYWHCSNKYNDDFYHKQLGMSAKEKRELDKLRLEAIKEERNIDTFIVWESEYNDNKEEVIKKCLEFLGVEND